MRNIIILALALVMGAAAADAHQMKAHKILGCKSAKLFIAKHGAALDALFTAEATGHLKTLGDMGKMKLDFLRALANSETPFGPACRNIGKIVKKLGLAVAFKRAGMAMGDDSTAPAEKAPAAE